MSEVQEVLEIQADSSSVEEKSVIEEVVITKAPVVWGNLTAKLREAKEIADKLATNKVVKESSENAKSDVELTSNRVKPRGFKKQSGDSNQNKHTKKFSNDKPRLSREKFEQELIKCKKAFYTHFNEYLKEEVQIEVKTSENPDSKKQTGPKSVKKTNLQRIQDGMITVNILRVIRDRELKSNSKSKLTLEPEPEQEPKQKPTIDNDIESELGFLDELVANRKMNFVFELSEHMAKFNVVVTQRGKSLMLHSFYIKL